MNRCAKGFYFLVLHLLSESLAVNIALWKDAEFCIKVVLSKKTIDGNKISTEAMDYYCFKTSFIRINLNAYYSVHFVIVFAGYGTDERQLDFFYAYIIDSPHTKVPCSKYPGKVKSGIGLRVNCVPSKSFFLEVEIESLKNKGLYITEIEVHTLGEDDHREHALIHRGCFADFGEKLIGNSSSLKDCQSSCMAKSYIFAGVKDTILLCACGNNIDESKSERLQKCNYMCEDGERKCGGDGYFSVYLVLAPLPHFKGCYRIPPGSLTVTEQLSDMTVARCLRLCDNYIFALLTKGNSCICTDDIDIRKVTDDMTECNSKCVGQSNIMCGGPRYASVFRTCKQDSGDYIKCSQLFKCLNTYDMYGDCGGACKEGFAGRHCLGNDVGSDILEDTEGEMAGHPLDICLEFDMCAFLPLSICKMDEDEVACACIDGFARDANQKCQDVNECLGDPCKDSFAVCTNLNGSYSCNCKSGYIIKNGFCRDENETFSDNDTSFDEESLERKAALLVPALTLIILALIICFTKEKVEKRKSVSSVSTSSMK